VFFNYLIETIQKVPATITIDNNIIDSEPILVDFIKDLISTLISVPGKLILILGHPDYGKLFFLFNYKVLYFY
jgi:hypothetical protein